MHGMAAGVLQDHRVYEIRPGLEYAYAHSLLAEVAGERSSDGGFALIGGGGADQQRAACA
jgi:hypothetical protein